MDSPPAATVPKLLLLGVPTLEVDGGGQTGIASRRRLLALLALLATAGRGGMSRDRIYASLWPDSDTDRASSSLRQAVFAIRRELGSEVLTGDAVLLRINPEALWVDLWAFEAAADAKRWQEAADLYRGPFLEGINVRGLPELERHFDGERARLARRALQAIENVAEGAAAAGHHQEAVTAWRRAVQIDPLGTRAALGLLKAMVDSGDRTAALEYGRVYELLVRAELDGEPDTSIAKFLARLRRNSGQGTSTDVLITGEIPGAGHVGVTRQRLTPSGGAGTIRPRSTPSHGGHAVGENRQGAGNGDRPSGPQRRISGRQAAQPPAPSRSWNLRPRLMMLAISASVVLSVAALALAMFSGGARFAAADQPSNPEAVIAVIPFQSSGDLPQNFSTSVAELIGSGLEGLGRIEVVPQSSIVAVDPPERGPDLERRRVTAARRLGATVVITGVATLAGERLRLIAIVNRAGGAARAERVTVEGTTDELLTLVDRLAREIVALRFDSPADRLKKSAALTTQSVAALRSFLAGEALLSEDRFGEAADAFSASIVHDTAFGLGYFRLTVAADLAARDSLAAWAAERATSPWVRLSERDRRLISGHVAARAGEMRRAETIYTEFVEDYPDDADGWLELGQLQYATSPLAGRSIAGSRLTFERAAALDPRNVEALVHLARIASLDGQAERADSLVAVVRANSGKASALELRALRAFALNDGTGRKRVTRALLAAREQGSASRGLIDVAARGHDIDGVDEFARSLAASDAPVLRGFGRRLHGQMELARGKWKKAAASYEQARLDAMAPALEQHSILATLPWVPVTTEELQALRRTIEGWDPELAEVEPIHNHSHRGLHAAIRQHRLGLLDERMGDSTAVGVRINALGQLRSDAPRTRRLVRTLTFSLMARLEQMRGRQVEALALLDSANWLDAGSAFEAEAADRFMRARLYEQLGRRDEAIRWYASMSQRAAYELVYLAPSQMRLAALYNERSDTENARRAAQTFLGLWEGADPAMRPMIDQARAIARR